MIKNFSKLLYSSLFILLLAGSSNAQEVIKGTVLGIEEGTRSPVTGASVQWINTTKGTITNAAFHNKRYDTLHGISDEDAELHFKSFGRYNA